MGAPYGQHFLSNPRAIGSIVARFDPRPDDTVVEIGPGGGALTRLLLGRVRRLLAVEIDARLAGALAAELAIPLLGEALDPACPPLEGPGAILAADATEVDYRRLAALLGAGADERLRVIGNLPYSVATALIQRMIRERDRVGDAVLMVQKEVADRLLASHGSRTYGLLSVLLALTAERGRVLSLGPGSFSPSPKVASTVVHFRFRLPPPDFQESDARLLAVLKASFSERRKKLAGNLAKRFGIGRSRAAGLLASCGADPEARAEAVAPDSYLRLAQHLPQ